MNKEQTAAGPGLALFDQVGGGILSGLEWIGRYSIFALRTIPESFRPPYELREFLQQLEQIGWRSVSLIAASGLAVGAVMSMHTRASLERFGAEAMIPAGLAIALVKETGPIVTGLLLSGRVGASIGAELGSMRISEQIDALESLAVDSFKFLVVTRVAACVIALPLLTTVMNFMGIVGGFIAENAVSGMAFWLYFNTAFSGIDFVDYVPSTLKTMVFGFVIGTVSCFNGYHTMGGTRGVGQATTLSVVLSSIFLILVNVILVRLIFFIWLY